MSNENKRLEKFDRFLKQMINRLTQKINLVKATQDDMIKFFTDNISGDVKVEFSVEMPNNGDFKYAEYIVKDYCNVTNIVNFAYRDIDGDPRYSGILYVVIAKATTKEYTKICDNPEINPWQVSFGDILNGILKRTKAYLSENQINFGKSAQKSVEDFLSTLLDGKVWIVTDAKAPDTEKAEQHSVVFEKETLKLAYVKGFSKGEYPNFLFIHVDKKTRESEFRDFCKKKYIPYNIVDEAIPLLNLHEKVIIHVFERPGLWRDKYKVAKNPIVIGQEYDPETGKFRTTRPIGLVDDNHLILALPNECLYGAELCYTFE